MELTITVEIEIDDEFIHNEDTLIDDLLGSWVKIKSGAYDNLALGTVTSVQKIPRKDA